MRFNYKAATRRIGDILSNPEYKFYYPVPAYWLPLLALIGAAIYFWSTGKLGSEPFIAFTLALIGWLVGAAYLTHKTRIDLQIEAVKEVRQSMQALSEAFMSLSVKARSDYVFQPSPLPQYFWHDKAQDYYMEMERLQLEVIEKYGPFYIALESHEMALAPLWHMYRHIILDIDQKLEAHRDMNSAFLKATADIHLTKEGYEKALKIYKPAQEYSIDVAVLFMDFRKAMHNKFFVSIFHKQLKPRKPRDGSKILNELAKKPDVARRMREREEG